MQKNYPEDSTKMPNIKAHEALNAILSSSFDGLWLIDKNGYVLLVNQGAERIHCLPKDELVNKHVTELSSMQVMDRSITLEVLKYKKSLSITQKLPRINREILATAHPVFDKEGEVKYVVIIDRDITELNSLRRKIRKNEQQKSKGHRDTINSSREGSVIEDGVINSKRMRQVYQKALQAAQTDSTILVTGESGVGKGFLVRLIHENSLNESRPFVHLDCGTIPESLIDSELFGYKKGAFTGANSDGKAGFLETADKGTLFLDEISELPINSQKKLLRFLDSKEFIPVGGVTTKRSSARVIAATNRDLKAMTASGLFRQDLFYRLDVVPIVIPPLRERLEDIPIMINYFLNKLNLANNTHKIIDREVIDVLVRYPFPGNVRELANIVEQMAVLSPFDVIKVEDVPRHLFQKIPLLAIWTGNQGWNLKKAVRELEREMIADALKRFGSQREAAKHLSIDQSTLARKAKKLGIRQEMVIHQDM